MKQCSLAIQELRPLWVPVFEQPFRNAGCALFVYNTKHDCHAVSNLWMQRGIGCIVLNIQKPAGVSHLSIYISWRADDWPNSPTRSLHHWYKAHIYKCQS